ncbi:hypothetical protein ACTMU2_22695 [Cupriavidus basilensis]
MMLLARFELRRAVPQVRTSRCPNPGGDDRGGPACPAMLPVPPRRRRPAVYRPWSRIASAARRRCWLARRRCVHRGCGDGTRRLASNELGSLRLPDGAYC